MKESTIINSNNQLWGALRSLAEGIKIAVLSQSVRDQAMEKLLISKGLITKEEVEAAVKAEAQAMIAEANKPAPEAPSGIILPPK